MQHHMNIFELFGTISINSSVANNTIDATMEKVYGLKETLEGTEDQANTTGKSLGAGSKINAGALWLGNTVTTITNKIANWTAQGVKAASKMGIGFNANIETYQKQFEALLQNEEAAKNLVERIKELAKATPLGMEGLTNNAVSLLNAGTELESVIPTLEMLGNLSLGDANKMDAIVRAYTQIIAKGQLMAQEMYQLSDAGVPIKEIMTLYGGDEYADGSWFQEKMNDPKYHIMAEDMVNAFRIATEEGGKWNDYMFQMMETYSGQMDRFGESGKETIGNITEPFFKLLSSVILPRLTSSLETFNEWVTENKESITAFSEAIGNFVVSGFDKSLDAFKWLTEHGTAVKIALWGIAGAMIATTAAAHPYIAALASIVGYVESIKTMQNEINTKGEALGIDMDGLTSNPIGYTLDAQKNTKKSPFEIIRTLNNTKPAVEVGAELEEGAGTDLQNELDGTDLSVDVKVNPVLSWLGGLFGGLGGGTHSGGYGNFFGNADGSHANGLDYVPRDNYRALLHKGEAVLTRSEAAERRDGGDIVSAVREAFAGVSFNVVLDTGVMVGQLAPKFDAKLGTIAGQKGRGN